MLLKLQNLQNMAQLLLGSETANEIEYRDIYAAENRICFIIRL